MELTVEKAEQFAIMLSSGMPALEVARYFFSDFAEGEQVIFLKRWLHSKELQAAIKRLQGKGWEKMSVEERLRYSIDKHYSEMAYFLFSHNYGDLTGNDKTKADTCRSAIEARLAGMAGKVDALTAFFNDLTAGRIRPLGGPAPAQAVQPTAQKVLFS